MKSLCITLLMRQVFLLIVVLLGSCSFFQEKKEEKVLEDNLISLESQGQTILLGALPTGQKSWVRFDYNFELGKTEVTVKEFESVLGFLPTNLPQDVEEQLPVTLVNIFDAVRYCNALSKKAKLDTVYQYLNAELALNGQTTDMEGLVADLSKNGYRLPTEAEWLFASKGTTASEFAWGDDSSADYANQYAWTSLNSDEHAQPVASKKKTGKGFFDLTGNAQEMVWGRWSVLPTDTTVNYIGPTDVSVQPLVIVKGGSFSHSLSAGKNSMRKDVYSVYPSTRLNYLGFRVAKGVIAKPTYSDGKGGLSQGSPFQIVATRKDIQAFFKTSRAKLAFVNATNGSLATVDFAPMGFSSKEIHQGVNVANPVFSPDGKQLAFATRYEGQTGKSQGYVVQFPGDSLLRLFTNESAYRPRWWIDPKTENWWIVVGDSGASNSEVERWEKGTTRAVAWRNASDRILTTSGSYHSGISNDARYLVTGYTRLLRFDSQSKESKDLFLSPENGKDAEGSTQACNVSVRPGPDPDILFLDFGYPRKSSITGGSYGIHEYLFSANMQSGKVEKHFKVPSGYSAWGYSLWSNHPDYLVAAVADGGDFHKALYALRYSDGAMLKLAEGADLIMPALWLDSAMVESGVGDREDFGRYDQPENFSNIVWNTKMYSYWSSYGTRDAYIFGTSREWHGIDPSGISEYNFVNMAGAGIGNAAGMEWARLYLWNRPVLPKLLILGIGPEFSANYTLSWFANTMSTSLGFLADQEHSYWQDSLPSDVQKTLLENGRLGKDFFMSAEETFGYRKIESCISWGEPILNIDNTWENGLQDWGDGWIFLRDFIKEATGKGIRVATVIIPTNPRYKETPYYSRHGGLRKEVLAFLDSVKSLEHGNPNFRHFDFHHDGEHDFKDNEAADTDHLCSMGALRVTDSLRQALKQWDSE